MNAERMHVYFVRHGETDLNRQFIHQSPGTPLNARGYDQSRTVAEALRPMNATLLISSTYERAAQTARIIGATIGVPPTYSTHFREVVRPSVFVETHLFHPRTLLYLFLTTLFRNDPNWRYKDGENFSDIHARVEQSFRYIESLIEAHDSIIIVSHTAYITLMALYMCHGERLTLRELMVSLLNIKKLKNCEITHVEYVGPTTKGTCPWLIHPET